MKYFDFESIEKIHSDVWGLMSKLGRGELLCFINDLSNYDVLDVNLKYLKCLNKFRMKHSKGSNKIHNEDKNYCDKDKRIFNHQEKLSKSWV